MRIDDVIEQLTQIKEEKGNLIVCVFDGVLIGYTTCLSFETVEDDEFLDEEEKMCRGDFLVL